MEWIEAKVIFDSPDIDLARELISDIFYEFGLQGVVIEDPEIDPAVDWAPDAVDISEAHAVIGFIPYNKLSDKRRKKLEDSLEALTQAQRFTYHLAYRNIDEQDWAEAWKAYFWPIKISDTLVVKPTWREYTPAQNEQVIEIDPGMAFGTGSHPTTSLCLNLIETYCRPGCRFLDIGCGSGILMIAARKLGAAHVSGIDIDEVAIAVAGKNLLANQIPSDQFQLVNGPLAENWEAGFDIVTANILSDVVIGLLGKIKPVLADQGVLICSGIVKDNHQQVVDALHEYGFKIDQCIIKEDWVAISATLAVRNG